MGMTNKGETLDWLYRLRSEIYVYMPKEWLIPMNNALDMAIKTLEQEPDCISRKAILDELEKWDWQELYLPIHFKQMLDELPSVTPQEPFMATPCISSRVCEHDRMVTLDKIRAEIEGLDYITFDGITKRRCLEIIEKYKAETEDV